MNESFVENAFYCFACGAEIDHMEERKTRRCWPCMPGYRPQQMVGRDFLAGLGGLGDRIWTADQLLFRANRDKKNDPPLGG